MKAVVVALATLAFAAPAVAQEWPKQDWSVFKVTPRTKDTPAFAMTDGGANPFVYYNYAGTSGGGLSPDSRRNIAVNRSSITRAGAQAEVRYYIWPDDRSYYTEVTSRIDCARTGEQIVAQRAYDHDFNYIGGSDRGFRRTDVTAREVALQVCGASRVHGVSDKSLPELVQGGGPN